MKYLVAAFLILASTHVWSRSLRLTCSVHHNTTLVFQRELDIVDGEKNVVIGSFQLFTAFLSSLPDGRYELQMLSATEPTRAYATGMLSEAAPELELTVWTRDFLFDIKCRRN